MTFYLAVDAGGTSTRAAVLGADGACVGYARAGSGNPVSSGREHAAREVVAAATAALASAGVEASRVASGVAGMAGASVHGDASWLRGPLADAGVAAPFVLRSDLLATYFAGTHLPHGYALVSGTGAVAIRVHDGEVDLAADGLGWLLGDEGSGFAIGRAVTRAAAADLDQRAPQTALTGLLLSRLGIAVTEERDHQGRPTALGALLTAVYAMRPIDLAAFAPLAFEAQQDAVAAEILREVAGALRSTLAAVVDPGRPGPLVVGGSVLAHHPDLAESIARSAGEAVTEVRTVPDGLAGAALLALRLADRPAGEDEFGRIADTLVALRPV